MLLEILLFVFSLFSLAFVYRWGKKDHDFFVKRNIPYEKPAFIFGGSLDIILRRKTVVQALLEMHMKYKGM